jgi:Saf4/Yju2 protein
VLGSAVLPRFYIKCVTCSQEITFKTDPQNADYELEIGATRNFEDWKKEDSAKVKHEEDRAAEDKGDAMKVLVL